MKKILLVVISILQTLSIISQTIDAELSYSETNIIIDNGKLTKTISKEIKIYNRAGERYTSIEIPFSKNNKISKLEAYIKDEYGSVVKKLKKNDIVVKSSIADYSLYEDDFIMEFTLKHNDYPYFVYYKYHEKFDEFMYIEFWRPVLNPQISTGVAKLHFVRPKEYEVAFKTENIDSFSVDSAGSNISYSWTASYKNTIHDEVFSPSIDNSMPSVIIVPDDFIYDKSGSFKSWKAYGNWQYELNQGLSELPDTEKKMISSLVKGIKEERGKVKVLYHYLQDHTRYINISIGSGGMKPYPASYVAENKYGDCKALTNYFKSMLQYVGIQSYYTKVNAGEHIDEIDLSFPSQQFNHVILYVPQEKDTIWLDCTSNMAFNYLGTFTQNRMAFVVDKDKSAFFRTPMLTPNEVLESRVIKIESSDLNVAKAQFYNTYKGAGYESLFSLKHNYSKSEQDKVIRDYFVEKGFESNNYNIIEEHRDSIKIHLTYSGNSNKIYKKYGNEVLMKLIPFSFPRFENPSKRKLDIKIDYPIFKVDSIEYIIPQDYSLSSSLQNQVITSEFGSYKLEFIIKNNRVLVVKSFYLKTGKYQIAIYNKIYDFVNKIAEIENKTYLVTTSNN